MSEETTTAPTPPVSTDDALDFYRSLTPDRRHTERDIIALTLDNNIFPESVRYGIFETKFRGQTQEVFRGVIKSIDGERYYFQLPPNGVFHIVKADTDTKKWDAERMMKGCSLGCDLVKAKKDDEEDEDEKKSGKAGGGIADMPPPAMPEAHDVQTTDSQITESHPGGAMGTTPQQDGSAERWHGSGHIERALPPIDPSANPNAWSTNDLLKAWGQQLQATAPKLAPVDPQMRKYMTEVMGKTPQEIDSGRVSLNGMQRAQYNQWLTRSTRTNMSGLEGWLQKSRTRGT